MPDNRNHKRPIQVKFFVDETERGLIKARMAQLGIENMTSYLRKISASIHSRERTAKSGTDVTEVTPVPQNLNFAFFDKRQEAFRSLFLLPLHREHRHALQALDLHAERAASGGENLPVVGNERLRAGDAALVR